MIISWFEKRVRRNVENLFAVVHGQEKRIIKESPQFSLTGLDYLPEEVRHRVERLQVWRRNRSSVRGIPPYRIFHNKTLLHLAVKNPMTKDELSQIPGIKVKRMEDFGDELLSLLKSGDAGNLAAQN